MVKMRIIFIIAQDLIYETVMSNYLFFFRFFSIIKVHHEIKLLLHYRNDLLSGGRE